MRIIKQFAAVAALALACHQAYAENGVTDTSVTFGMSTPLTGPASAQGQEIKNVVSAYFEQVNKTGGVNGRKLQLVALDDGYEADKAVANTKTLINTNKVFALLGYYGSNSIAESMNNAFGPAAVPMIGGISGSPVLRQSPAANPNTKFMFNLRASYADETETIVTQLATLGIKNIAVFFQNDGFGKAGLESLTTALKKYNLAPVATGSVERNSDDISKALDGISKSNAQAVVMVVLQKPAAAMVKALHKLGQHPMFMTLSPVSAEQLSQELGAEARGIGISQVMPYPWNETIAISKEYQRFTGKQGTLSYTGIEAFIMAKTAVETLRKLGNKDITREKLVSTLETSNQDLGGYRVSFSPTNRAGSKFVELTVIGANGKLMK